MPLDLKAFRLTNPYFPSQQLLVTSISSDSDSVKVKESQKTDLVEMLDCVTYLVCQDDPVYSAQFCKVGVLMIN